MCFYSQSLFSTFLPHVLLYTFYYNFLLFLMPVWTLYDLFFSTLNINELRISIDQSLKLVEFSKWINIFSVTLEKTISLIEEFINKNLSFNVVFTVWINNTLYKRSLIERYLVADVFTVVQSFIIVKVLLGFVSFERVGSLQ